MMRFRHSICCTLFLMCAFSFALAEGKTDAAVEKRIDALVKQMTLPEKAGQLSQYDGISPQTAEAP